MNSPVKFGCGRVVVHFPAGGTAEWIIGAHDEEAGFITQYAGVCTEGHSSRAIRELLNRGIACGFSSLSVFESLLWETTLGFPTGRLNALVDGEWFGLPSGSISAISFDENERPVDNTHAEFDEAREKVLIAALAEAYRASADISIALEFLLMLGYARWVEE